MPLAGPARVGEPAQGSALAEGDFKKMKALKAPAAPSEAERRSAVQHSSNEHL